MTIKFGYAMLHPCVHFNPLSELLVKLNWSHLNKGLVVRTSSSSTEGFIMGSSANALGLTASSEMFSFSETSFKEDFFFIY